MQLSFVSLQMMLNDELSEIYSHRFDSMTDNRLICVHDCIVLNRAMIYLIKIKLQLNCRVDEFRVREVASSNLDRHSDTEYR